MSKSINPYVSTLGSILVSKCCEAEALYRIRDSEKETSFDRWSFYKETGVCPGEYWNDFDNEIKLI